MSWNFLFQTGVSTSQFLDLSIFVITRGKGNSVAVILGTSCHSLLLSTSQRPECITGACCG